MRDAPTSRLRRRLRGRRHVIGPRPSQRSVKPLTSYQRAPLPVYALSEMAPAPVTRVAGEAVACSDAITMTSCVPKLRADSVARLASTGKHPQSQSHALTPYGSDDEAPRALATPRNQLSFRTPPRYRRWTAASKPRPPVPQSPASGHNLSRDAPGDGHGLGTAATAGGEDCKSGGDDLRACVSADTMFHGGTSEDPVKKRPAKDVDEESCLAAARQWWALSPRGFHEASPRLSSREPPVDIQVLRRVVC